VESADVEMIHNQRAVCKFRKADEIYKQILSIYAEKASTITGFKVGGDECAVIAFCSASGGVGSSTMAAACAAHFAAKGSKVLYLNLEKFGTADLFFAGQGNYDMSDIIFALKKQNVNLPMKLEGCVRQDPNGVYFYAGTKLALDMMELNMAEILRLINELKISGGYDYMIKACAKDIKHLEQKLLRIKGQRGVTKSQTMISLMEHKCSPTVLPTLEENE
jgi:DNA-binding Lrp family transcriptional regulator